ncbi:hypothetical protein ECG_08623 [Echinococcus granulosus]|nr:hypothetical protein ECG_08623 [Echinococcus granulosus]
MEEFEEWLFAVLSPDSDNSLSLVPAPHNLPFDEVFYGPTSQEAEMMDLKRNVDPPLIGAVHHALCNPDDPLPFQKSAVREPSVQVGASPEVDCNGELSMWNHYFHGNAFEDYVLKVAGDTRMIHFII